MVGRRGANPQMGGMAPWTLLGAATGCVANLPMSTQFGHISARSRNEYQRKLGRKH